MLVVQHFEEAYVRAAAMQAPGVMPRQRNPPDGEWKPDRRAK